MVTTILKSFQNISSLNTYVKYVKITKKLLKYEEGFLSVFTLNISCSKMHQNARDFWNILFLTYRSTAKQRDKLDLLMYLMACYQIRFTELYNVPFCHVLVGSAVIGLADLL
jgi:hypothetical protein